MIQIITKKLNFEKPIEPKAMNLQFYFIVDQKKKNVKYVIYIISDIFKKLCALKWKN